MCFAAGMLISAAFLHIIPKSFSMNPQAPTWLLIGFFGMHLFNRFLTAFVCEKDPDKREYAIGIVPMIGIGFHSFIDGFIYSIAFTVSILTGFLATMGMVLHEFPEGIITYLLLVRGGFSERKSMFLERWARCFHCPQARWSTWGPRTFCRERSRRKRNTAWLPWQAVCWSPWSSSHRRPETRTDHAIDTPLNRTPRRTKASARNTRRKRGKYDECGASVPTLAGSGPARSGIRICQSRSGRRPPRRDRGRRGGGHAGAGQRPAAAHHPRARKATGWRRRGLRPQARTACQCFIARPPLPCSASSNSSPGMAPRKSLAWQEIWRKRAGVEPTRDRMAAPPGFEDRAPHRGTISSMFMRASSQALRLRDAARGRRGRGECSRCDRRTRESGSSLCGRRCHRQK